jgi:Amt family ammonium transporter
MGPRHGRFDAKGNSVDMPGHSIPMAAMGGFILLFGFLAFNGGSQVRIAMA